jgi:cell division protein FtsB
MRSRAKRWVLGIACVVVSTCALVTFRGPNGFPALKEKQRQIQLLEKHNAAQARIIEGILGHIQRLKNNPAEQEREIQEQYKLVHPGDKVFITGEPEKP